MRRTSLLVVTCRGVAGGIGTVLLAASTVWSASVVQVTVTDTDGKALPGATALLVEMSQECVTGADGTCQLVGVPAGPHHVAVRMSGFAPSRQEVIVLGDASAIVSFALSTQVHFTESVTVGPGSRDTFESYQPAKILAGEDLQQRLGASLGDTLAKEAGVNVRSFGPGPARPVVRGLDGDRVLVLENGSRTGDLSSQSGDHGVTVDPASATQIEVVRGPATLLYGSSALGGVVNLISDEIPTKPITGSHGAVVLQGGTANEEGGAAANVTVGNGHWAFRAGGAAHRTGDVDTPEGTIPNSQSNLKLGGGAVSYTAENGYAGASYQYTATTYGVPFVEEGGTTLDPRRHRLDLRLERRNLAGFVEGLKVQGAYRDYTHDEHEADGTVATTFKNKFTEGQLLLNHREVGRLKGTVGLWATHRDYSSQGEEALAPPTTQGTVAGFFYEELTFPHVTVQFGGRVDHSTFSPDALAVPERTGIRARNFTVFSGSLGVLGHLREDLTLALNVARAGRNPSLEELYNFGPHVGNFAFEVGNPDLAPEIGVGIDVSLRHRGPRLALEGTVFRNSIDNYIFPFQTGEMEDDLPVINFRSRDSLLQGFELHADVGLTDALWLELGGDGVRGAERATGEALPRIPPYRVWAGARYEAGRFHLEAEVRAAARQGRVYGSETPTPGYTVVNVHGSYTVTTGTTVHTVTLRLDNASDTLHRNHLSYIKDRAAEMGRSLKAVYSVRF